MPPPPPAPQAPQAPTTSTTRRTAAIRTAGAGLVCGAVGLVLVGSGLWQTVAGMVAAAVAVVLGVAALVRSRGLSPRRALVLAGVFALLLGGLDLATGGARLALWPVTRAYEQCVTGTVTLSGAARCRQQLEEGIWSYLGGPGTPAPEDASGAPSSGTPPEATTGR